MKILDCNFADDVLNDAEHDVWLRGGADSATLGVNPILVWVTGPISSVTVKEVGARVERGKSVGSIEGPRHFDVVRSPISGTIVEVNGRLKESPTTVNKSPYGDGWFVRVRPSNWSEENSLLRTTAAAKEAFESKIRELRVHCFAEYPDREMFEIGTECSAALMKLGELAAGSPKDTVVHFVSDDPTSPIEIVRWCEMTKNALLESRQEGNLYHFIIKKTGW